MEQKINTKLLKKTIMICTKKFLLLLATGMTFTGVFAQTTTYHGSSAGTSGSYNTNVGYYAGNKSTGTQNTMVGSSAGRNTTGNYNTIYGVNSGYYNTSGSNNSYFGRYAGNAGTTGNSNTFFGYWSGINNKASNNTFFGTYSGRDNSDGTYNVYFGRNAGMSGTTGDNNTYIGYDAGRNNKVGVSNVFIGYQAGSDELGSNLLYISNSNTQTPLIKGNFATNALTINGTLTTTGNMTSQGDVYGKSVDGSYSNLYRFGGLYLTWDSDTYGTNTSHSIRSTYGDSYGDDITINTYDNLRINLDSDDNTAESFFEIGHHTTGTSDVLFTVKSPTGEVGIGTQPLTGYKLAVNGKIKALEVSITTDGWADYVFEKNYNLKSLEEVEAFIQENKHLPDVPSEAEVLENGIAVGEMSTILLQKIEELTLYLIDQNKRIENLQEIHKTLSDSQ